MATTYEIELFMVLNQFSSAPKSMEDVKTSIGSEVMYLDGQRLDDFIYNLTEHGYLQEINEGVFVVTLKGTHKTNQLKETIDSDERHDKAVLIILRQFKEQEPKNLLDLDASLSNNIISILDDLRVDSLRTLLNEIVNEGYLKRFGTGYINCMYTCRRLKLPVGTNCY